MKIKVGQIVKAKHQGNDGKKYYHPFLIINITPKNIYALQCTSVKAKDDDSYFSRKGEKVEAFLFSKLDYKTHIDTNNFYKIESSKIKAVLEKADFRDFHRVTKKLQNTKWQDTAFWNNNEIQKQITKGIEQLNGDNEWEI